MARTSPEIVVPPAGDAGLQECAGVILEFLQSKCLFAVERALRLELELGANSSLAADVEASKLTARNLWTSKLEEMLGVSAPLAAQPPIEDIVDHTPSRGSPTPLDAAEDNIGAGNCVPQSKMLQQRQKRRPKLFELRPDPKRENEETYRKRRNRDHMNRVVFHDPPPMSSDKARKLAHISLPVLYNPHINGLEDNADLPLEVGQVLVERYRIVAVIGKGSFSRVVQASAPRCSSFLRPCLPAAPCCLPVPPLALFSPALPATTPLHHPLLVWVGLQLTLTDLISSARSPHLLATHTQLTPASWASPPQAFDIRERVMVSIKVLRNEKDCLDQGIGEIRILA